MLIVAIVIMEMGFRNQLVEEGKNWPVVKQNCDLMISCKCIWALKNTHSQRVYDEIEKPITNCCKIGTCLWFD